MRWRTIGQKTGVLLVLVAALAGVALVAPQVVTTITPSRLAVADDVIARIWWPATALRLLVYGLLAWGLYPVWVRARLPASVAALAALPPAGSDPPTDAERAVYAARLGLLQRAAGRQWIVFGWLAGSDVLIAQFPYWLLRG